MGWIIDAVIGVLLLIVLLINLFMGFQKCGLNNAFTALNVVLSCPACWLPSFRAR